MFSHSMARDALIYTGVNGSGGAGSEDVCGGKQPRPHRGMGFMTVPSIINPLYPNFGSPQWSACNVAWWKTEGLCSDTGTYSSPHSIVSGYSNLGTIGI